MSGNVYAVDDIQPAPTEEPRARVDVFNSAGAYQGHLKYDVIDGAPTGLAVDNSSNPRYPTGRGRVYVSSGNTHQGGIYAYQPGGAASTDPSSPGLPADAARRRAALPHQRRSAAPRRRRGGSPAKAMPARRCPRRRSTRP